MFKKYVDTHVHLLISKKQIVPDWESINNIIDVASADGISGICVAEHIEANGYENLMRGLFVDNVLGGELREGVLVFKNNTVLYPAAELQLANGSNIGVHANVDCLLKLNSRAGFYSLTELNEDLDRFSENYAMVAHHIYWPGKTYPDHHELSRWVHAIEVPAKDVENSKKYLNLAGELGLPTTGGSDSHTFIQTGACQTLIKSRTELLSHRALIDVIRNGECESIIHFHSRRLVQMSNLYRKAIAAIN